MTSLLKFPVHPGEILKKEYLTPSCISAATLATQMKIHVQRVHEILRGKRSISPNTAIRLGIVFGTSYDFWLTLQRDYDLKLEKLSNLETILKEVKSFRS